IGDFLGQGATTPAVFRRSSAGTGQWFAKGNVIAGNWTASGNPPTSTKTFGSATTDIPVVGDFDGDAIADTATYAAATHPRTTDRATGGRYSYTTDATGPARDVPVAADFDGDGITDPGVYNPVNGLWTIVSSKNGLQPAKAIPAGSGYTSQSGDTPVP